EVIEGDSQAVPFGTGTFNSRSMALGGSAVYLAAGKIMEKVTQIAAYKLQLRPRDLVYEHGVFRPRPHAGVGASIAHSAKRTAQKVLPIVFKLRVGFDLPTARRDVDAVSFAEIARDAHLGAQLPLGMVPGLDETHVFDPKDIVFAYGAHVAIVE